MTTSPLLRRLQKLERRRGDPNGPRFVILFRPEPGEDPFLDAIGDRKMTSEEWVRWARAGQGLAPLNEVEA